MKFGFSKAFVFLALLEFTVVNYLWRKENHRPSFRRGRAGSRNPEVKNEVETDGCEHSPAVGNTLVQVKLPEVTILNELTLAFDRFERRICQVTTWKQSLSQEDLELALSLGHKPYLWRLLYSTFLFERGQLMKPVDSLFHSHSLVSIVSTGPTISSLRSEEEESKLISTKRSFQENNPIQGASLKKIEARLSISNAPFLTY